jgi:hypothetical protein
LVLNDVKNKQTFNQAPMTIKPTLTLLAIISFLHTTLAQSFLLPPTDFFEGINPAVIVKLKNGELLKGKINSLNTLKRNTPTLIMEDGGEMDLSSDDVWEYYHPISKSSRIFNNISPRSLYTNQVLENFDNNDNTAGFIVVRIVEINGREGTLDWKENTTSLYLLNPDFASRIQVYSANDDDDRIVTIRMETELRSFAPSAYLVAKDGNPAYRVRKSKYKTAFYELFGDCPALSNVEKPNFKDFAEHVYFYTNNCE